MEIIKKYQIKLLKKKQKIKNSVQFRTKKYDKNYEDRIATYEDGILDSHFWATRYDYLRIAKAMLDDWQNDTCVGKYLKTVFNNRVKKITKEMWIIIVIGSTLNSMQAFFTLDIQE